MTQLQVYKYSKIKFEILEIIITYAEGFSFGHS